MPLFVFMSHHPILQPNLVFELFKPDQHEGILYNYCKENPRVSSMHVKRMRNLEQMGLGGEF